MGNKTELQGHNIDLNRIIDIIGSLPTAQNWSGGGYSTWNS